MKTTALALTIVGLLASVSNAAVVLTFLGSYEDKPPALSPDPQNLDFKLVLQVSSSGAVLGGTYTRPPGTGESQTSLVTSGMIQGLGAQSLTFNLTLDDQNPPMVFQQSGDFTLDSWSLSSWQQFASGNPTGILTYGSAFGEIGLVSAVPEPGTWALMGSLVAGAAGLGRFRKRRKRQVASAE
jgi:hypothetical protein